MRALPVNLLCAGDVLKVNGYRHAAGFKAREDENELNRVDRDEMRGRPGTTETTYTTLLDLQRLLFKHQPP